MVLSRACFRMLVDKILSEYVKLCKWGITLSMRYFLSFDFLMTNYIQSIRVYMQLHLNFLTISKVRVHFSWSLKTPFRMRVLKLYVLNENVFYFVSFFVILCKIYVLTTLFVINFHPKPFPLNRKKSLNVFL